MSIVSHIKIYFCYLLFSTSLLGWVAVDKDVEGKDVDELAANTTWPSQKLFRASIQKMLKSIWDDYLSGKVSLQSYHHDTIYN